LPYIAVNVDNTLANTSLAGDVIPADLPEEFYLKHLKELYFKTKPYPGAVETMSQIVQYCDLVYTTARPRGAGFITLRWLAINGFPDGQLLFIPPQERYFLDSIVVIDDDPRVPALYPPEWADRLYAMAQPYNKLVHAHRFAKWSRFLDMLNSVLHGGVKT
jgi:hypothetical protein